MTDAMTDTDHMTASVVAAGTCAFTVRPEDLPLPAYPDLKPGDVLFISPNDAGEYVQEQEGKRVLVGTLRGHYITD